MLNDEERKAGKGSLLYGRKEDKYVCIWGVGAMYVERDQSLSIHPDTNVGYQVSQFR